MAKGEFDMLYLCAGASEKNPWDYQGGLHKNERKNKEIIIAHPLDKLWMLP